MVPAGSIGDSPWRLKALRAARGFSLPCEAEAAEEAATLNAENFGNPW